MLTIDRKTVGMALGIVVLAWWLNTSPLSPLAPPAPPPKRPVLHALGKLASAAARIGLWVTLAGERPAEEPPRDHLVKAPAVDADGHRVIDNSEGW